MMASVDPTHGYEKAQLSKQRTRSIEASKQMLYDVFGFVIAMLEEFERRELEQEGKDPSLMPMSNIQIPEQRQKRFEDVKRVLEAELVMFESQLSASPKKAKNKIKNQLKWKTFDWAAIRAQAMPDQVKETDRYLAKLYEILSTGRTQHPESEEVTTEDMKSFLPAIVAGRMKQEDFDNFHKTNRDKKAVPTNVRSPSVEFMFKAGAERIARLLPNLHDVVLMDVKEFENILEKNENMKMPTETDLEDNGENIQ